MARATLTFHNPSFECHPSIHKWFLNRLGESYHSAMLEDSLIIASTQSNILLLCLEKISSPHTFTFSYFRQTSEDGLIQLTV